MSPEQKLVTYLTEKSIDSQFIIQSLDDFAKKITKLTVVIIDNAPWHKSKYIQAKIDQWEQKGAFILYLPTYSPHLNKIETLWRFINGVARAISVAQNNGLHKFKYSETSH